MSTRKADFLWSPCRSRSDMLMREQGASSLLREQRAALGRNSTGRRPTRVSGTLSAVLRAGTLTGSETQARQQSPSGGRYLIDSRKRARSCRFSRHPVGIAADTVCFPSRFFACFRWYTICSLCLERKDRFLLATDAVLQRECLMVWTEPL